MEKAGERGEKDVNRKGDMPQVSRVTNEKLVWEKPSEVDPSAWGKSPSACVKKGKEGGWRSGKNAIIKAGRSEKRWWVRAPKRENGRRRAQSRGIRSVKDALVVWGLGRVCALRGFFFLI